MLLSNDCAVTVLFTVLPESGEAQHVPEAVNRLTAYEQSRYIGKLNPLHRLQFLAGRLLAQQLFAEHCPGAVCSLQTDNASGKPRIAGQPGWGISISHSGALVACALNPLGPAGIDVEAIRPVDLAAFQTYLLPREWRFIQRHHDPPSAFFTLWTRKEAVAKADGRGLGLDFQHLDALNPDFPVGQENWSCQSLPLQPGFAAALAFSKITAPAGSLIRRADLPDLLVDHTAHNETST
ncbi:MAG: 4'-phosphopantetheinyl transferase superfamily protein [Saprospiraceae bacterium]|nr:4'-phosphopantetheinyl transferase superfamily protein [Saprospiraceae bacterium]